MKIKSQKDSGKVLFLVVCGAVCFLLYSSVFPFATGTGAVLPELMLCLCCAVSSLYDKKTCCIFAVLSGFVTDLSANQPFCFSPVIYLVSVICVVRLGGFFKRRGTINTAVCSFPALLLREIVIAMHTSSVIDGMGIKYIVFENIIPSVAVNFAFVMVVAFVVRRLNNIFVRS